MTLSQLLLAAAILAVFLMWRRTRSQVAAARADIEAHRARNTFTFEADEHGRGFIIRDQAGGQIEPGALRWSEHGLELIEAVARPDAREELLPGTALDLEHVAGRIEVRDHTGAAVADIDGAAAATVLARLEAGEIGSCIVLRQLHAGERTLPLILIHPAVDTEL